MHIHYERDHARRRVTVTVHGEYHASEVLALFERHHVENDWSDARLYDARRLTGQPTLNELRLFIGLDTANRPHGPEAIIVRDSLLYASACQYAVLGQSTLMIEVFRDPDEAERWLMGQR
jgi:hypothetical protein